MMDKSLLEWQVDRILKETSRQIKVRNIWSRILEESAVALVVVGLVAGMCWLYHSITTPKAQEPNIDVPTQEIAR